MLYSHRNLIERFAQNALEKNGLRLDYYYEDALGEGLLAFVEALNSFDPNMGTRFSTWLWYHLRHRVGGYIHQERRQREIERVLGTGAYTPKPRKRKAIKLHNRKE